MSVYRAILKLYNNKLVFRLIFHMMSVRKSRELIIFIKCKLVTRQKTFMNAIFHIRFYDYKNK